MNLHFTKFRSTSSSAQNSRDRIKEEMGSYLHFGVKYLDDALVGIAKTDLILVAGRSGGGKTELAVHVAMTNALGGKRVYFFALEAEEDEIADRIKYKILANCYFNESNRYAHKYVAYDRWKAGLLENEFAPYESIANESMGPLDNLKVRYGSENYTIEDYSRDIEEIRGEADLIIIDHLHYFDIDESQANAELKAIMKRIKALALEHKVPIILVSHIRKMDRRYSGLVPDQEDFHGSSDIIKIATKAITIASGRGKKCLRESGTAFENIEIKDGTPSFIRAVKNRRNGAVTSSLGLITFRHDSNTYSEGYILGEEKIEKGEAYFLETKKDAYFPKWAEGAQNG